MPQESKVKWAQLRVGMMAIAALAILGYLIVLLSGSHGFFKSKSTLLAFVGDSGDIAQGAPVRLNGIVVGKVKKVALSGSADPRRQWSRSRWKSTPNSCPRHPGGFRRSGGPVEFAEAPDT